jgi:hypothetical protein
VDYMGQRGTRTDDRWLFPGPLPDTPISSHTLSDRMRAICVEPAAARSTALVDLALRLPPTVLSRLIGVRPHTAVEWAASQARYAATRTSPVFGGSPPP